MEFQLLMPLLYFGPSLLLLRARSSRQCGGLTTQYLTIESFNIYLQGLVGDSLVIEYMVDTSVDNPG